MSSCTLQDGGPSSTPIHWVGAAPSNDRLAVATGDTVIAAGLDRVLDQAGLDFRAGKDLLLAVFEELILVAPRPPTTRPEEGEGVSTMARQRGRRIEGPVSSARQRNGRALASVFAAEGDL